MEERLFDPEIILHQSTLKVTGKALNLSQIKKHVTKDCKEVHICASEIIYVDCNWTFPGLNLALSAPVIQALNGVKRYLNTSGRCAPSLSVLKADNGKQVGENGKHGEHAGDVYIDTEILEGEIAIVACGGDGADGQNGGDGRDGTPGTNGSNGNLDGNRPRKLWGFWNRGFRSRSSLLVKDDGKQGTAGQNGGNGGYGGLGGKGGLGGQVKLNIAIGREACTFKNIAGKDGQNGQPGSGGKGGSGGQHGLTQARAFTANDGWMSFSGVWVEETGDLTCTKQKNFFGMVIGYKILKIGTGKGKASDGHHGQPNRTAADVQSNISVGSKKKSLSMSNVARLWNPEELETQPFFARKVHEREKKGISPLVEWETYEDGDKTKHRKILASVKIQKVNIKDGTGTNPNVRQVNKDRVNKANLPVEKYDTGHIIPNRMGGTGSELENLFPVLLNINRGILNNNFEAKVFKYLNDSPSNFVLEYTYSFTYEDNTAVPTSFQIETNIRDDLRLSRSQTFTNRLPPDNNILEEPQEDDDEPGSSHPADVEQGYMI